MNLVKVYTVTIVRIKVVFFCITLNLEQLNHLQHNRYLSSRLQHQQHKQHLNHNQKQKILTPVT